MIFTVLVPEYIIGRALNELLATKFKENSWHKIQEYMANMGYFVLDFEDYWTEVSGSNTGRRVEEEDQGDGSTYKSRPVEPGYSLQQTVADLAKELETYASASERLNLSRLTHRYWALSGRQLDYLIPNIIDPPAVRIRQMEVLNRGNALVKALALIQVIYLIVQLVARKFARLPSAQLEIGALAFSASSFITYALYWDRPQGVESVHIIKPKCAPSKVSIRILTQRGPLFLWSHPRPEYKFEKLYDVVPIPNDGLHTTSDLVINYRLFGLSGDNEEILILAAGAFLGGTFFGGLHCLAWNFHFPTHGEALTWRVCSVVTSVLPLLCVMPMFLWMRWHPWNGRPKRSLEVRFALGLVLIVGFLIPYVLARMFLICEMFRSLFFLPPEAFIDTWSGSFPHWG